MNQEYRTKNLTTYQVGTTTYTVTTHINGPSAKESIEDKIKRLILQESKQKIVAI